MVKAGFSQDYAEKSAAWVIENFDLAPKGMLQPLLEKAGELAKAHPERE